MRKKSWSFGEKKSVKLSDFQIKQQQKVTKREKNLSFSIKKEVE